MHAASQLPEGGPLMWMMPLHLHVYQKSNYDYDDMNYLVKPKFCSSVLTTFLFVCMYCKGSSKAAGLCGFV